MQSDLSVALPEFSGLGVVPTGTTVLSQLSQNESFGGVGFAMAVAK
jgi:hypothetical protein